MSMAIPIYGMADHQLLLYEKNDLEEDERGDLVQYCAEDVLACLELYQALYPEFVKRFKEDAWMWQEDWSKRNCTMPTWYTTLLRSKQLANLPIEQLNASDVKLRCRVIPRLFGLCWGPYPLHFKADKGWGFLVPRVDIDNAEAIAELSRASLRRGEEVNIPNRAILDVINENIINGVGDILLGEPVCTIGAFDFHKLPHPVIYVR
uniref:Uncharacterized protein n=1 Tax=Parascaris equorum TaxID=6256 RepID=A0A914S425_PAREQ